MGDEKLRRFFIFLLSAAAVLLSASVAGAQEVQERRRIQEREVRPIQVEMRVLESCHTDLETPFSGLPIEEGTRAFVWPDDAEELGASSLQDMVQRFMDNGDTLYLQPGTHEGPITAVDYLHVSPVGGGYKRIHIRGSGATNTIVEGYIAVGPGSSIADLRIDNSGIHSNHTTISCNQLGMTIRNVVVIGGRNGILIGASTDSSGDRPVHLECVTVTGALYNGIMVGDEYGAKADGSQLTNVTVSGTGRMGLKILGDDVVVENLRLNRNGSNGLLIAGDNARISNSSIFDTEHTGAIFEGNGLTINNLSLRIIGTNGVSITGNRARVNGLAIENTEYMGLLVEGNSTVIENLELQRIGTGGVRVEGANARISNSTLENVDLYGLGISGASSRIENVLMNTIGSSENGTGIIIYEESGDYDVRNCTFDTIRVGMLIQVADGQLSGNTFENIFYRDIIDTTESSDEPLRIRAREVIREPPR